MKGNLLPPAWTPHQVPKNGYFEVVFWPERDRPYLVRGLRCNATVSLMHIDSGRSFGYAMLDSGRLWAPVFFADLTKAWEKQKASDGEA